MFGLRSKKSLAGLDCGSLTTKLVQLDFPSQGGIVLNRADLIPTGLSDPDFVLRMKSYIKEQRLGHLNVALSFDDPQLKIRRFEFPDMPEADMIESARWGLRDLVEGDIEKYRIRLSRVAESNHGDGKKLDVMAYAIPEQVILDKQTLFKSIGADIAFLEPSAVSLASTLERLYPSEDRYCAIVSVGKSKSIFSVTGNGVLFFSRPMVGVTLSDQEGHANFKQKLAIEIQKSIDTFRMVTQMRDLDVVALAGGMTLVEDLENYLSTNLGLKIKTLNPFEGIVGADKVAQSDAPLFAEAFGLACVVL